MDPREFQNRSLVGEWERRGLKVLWLLSAFFFKTVGSAFSHHSQPYPTLRWYPWALHLQPPIWSWRSTPVHNIWDNSLSPSLAPEVTQQLNVIFPNFWVTSLTHIHPTKRPAQRHRWRWAMVNYPTDCPSSASSRVFDKTCVHGTCLPRVNISSVEEQPPIFMTTHPFRKNACACAPVYVKLFLN